MPWCVAGFRLSAVAAVSLLLPVANTASLKAPKQTAAAAPLQKGPAALEALLQKAVDSHHAKKGVHYKEDAQDDGEDSSNVLAYDEKEDRSEESGDEMDIDNEMDSAKPSVKPQQMLNAIGNRQDDSSATGEDSDEVDTDGELEDSSSPNSEDSNVMDTPVQKKTSSFLAKKGGDDDEDSVSAANDNEGEEHDEGNLNADDEESKRRADEVDEESADSGEEIADAFDPERQDEANSDEANNEQGGSELDNEGAALMQKPIRKQDADLQWRLQKSQLATKRARRRAGKEDERSVVYRLKTAAADLEHSVQKYMREDDEQAQHDLARETQNLQQDVAHELTEAPAPASPAPAKEAPAKEAPAEEAPAEDIDPYKQCEELCKFDKGMDADSCVTDCRSYVDTGGSVDSLKDFVTDETYNEQGGESMEKHFEKTTGKKVPDCQPTIDTDEVPTFESVDKDGDGAISRGELNDWALSACVPNELAQQVFDVADSDFDESVSKTEWQNVGEDLKTAQILDGYADRETQGEDQYEPVHIPPFADIDSDDNKLLDKDEIMKMFKEEIHKRIPNMREEDVEKLASQHEDAVLSDMDKLDTDKDGFINEEEFKATEDQHMGHELHEVAQNPNNLPDPDDLHRDPNQD